MDEELHKKLCIYQGDHSFLKRVRALSKGRKLVEEKKKEIMTPITEHWKYLKDRITTQDTKPGCVYASGLAL